MGQLKFSKMIKSSTERVVIVLLLYVGISMVFVIFQIFERDYEQQKQRDPFNGEKNYEEVKNDESSYSLEEFLLCKPVHHSSQQKDQLSCSKGPQNSSTLVVVGALNFLGSSFVSYLASKNIPVQAVTDFRDVLNTDDRGLTWYRAEMLHLHYRVSVKLTNLSNHMQVKEFLVKQWNKPSNLVFVIPKYHNVVNSDKKSTKNVLDMDKKMSDYLMHFATILEVVKEFSPCTQTALLTDAEVSIPKNLPSADSMANPWIATFEQLLSTYHYYYGIPIRIFRVHSIFGPWDDIILERYLTKDSRELQNKDDRCWYVEDAMKILLRDLHSAKKCGLVQLEDCKDYSKKIRVTDQLEHMDKSWGWAQSYAENFFYNKNNKKDGTALSNNVVFTSYFTSTKDYQRKKFMPANDIRYMQEFYLSLKEMRMKAIIFHDGLDRGFQYKVHSYYTNVTFVKVDSLQGRTTNDARYYAYFKYLLEHSNITKVLLTDISDVVFQRDPFELMSVLGDWLYVGTDNDLYPNTASMPWIKNGLKSCFGKYSVKQGELNELMKMETIYNAGTIGGSRTRVLSALAAILVYLNSAPPKFNCNMPAVNYAMHKHFFDEIFTGFPLNSRFFKWQSSPKGVYIIHK